MPEEPTKPATIISPRQFAAALAALALSTGVNSALPMMGRATSDAPTEKAIERIADELSHIRGSLVSTQIEMTKALATAMAELSDHSRRLERLEERRKW